MMLTQTVCAFLKAKKGQAISFSLADDNHVFFKTVHRNDGLPAANYNLT